MGSADGGDDEKPAHAVTIARPFYIGVHEVTQGQYEAVMGSNPSQFKGADRPVEQVSWEDARTFCRRLSEKEPGAIYRLPTSAEWECACRGATTGRYYFGGGPAALRRAAWFQSNAGMQTHNVDVQPDDSVAHPLGLHHMLGNVWEWCEDIYQVYPGGEPNRFMDGSRRVIRGGAFDSNHALLSTSARSAETVQAADPAIGFRVVREE